MEIIKELSQTQRQRQAQNSFFPDLIKKDQDKRGLLIRLFQKEEELPRSVIDCDTESERQKSESLLSFGTNKESKEFSSIVNSLKVYLIKEQRLIKKKPSGLISVIEVYSQELKLLIDEKRDEYGKTSEKLSADFSKRVLNSKEIISKDIVKSKVERLEEKQKLLKKYGLSMIELDIPDVEEIEENDLKLVSVDLTDLEEKLSVFDDLLGKIKLFIDLLDEKKLSFKHIEIYLNINSKQGFICKNDKVEISLEKLSSGEKHRIVLLYELIFKTTENTLLLIDEPEISWHVVWQHDFIEDLKKIIELKNIQAIVATHAPAIINDHWDLVTDLFDESEKNQAK